MIPPGKDLEWREGPRDRPLRGPPFPGLPREVSALEPTLLVESSGHFVFLFVDHVTVLLEHLPQSFLL